MKITLNVFFCIRYFVEGRHKKMSNSAETGGLKMFSTYSLLLMEENLKYCIGLIEDDFKGLFQLIEDHVLFH